MRVFASALSQNTLSKLSKGVRTGELCSLTQKKKAAQNENVEVVYVPVILLCVCVSVCVNCVCEGKILFLLPAYTI